ncbi:pre-mRNA-processing factor 39-like [Rhinophrynus dorsalis]
MAMDWRFSKSAYTDCDLDFTEDCNLDNIPITPVQVKDQPSVHPVLPTSTHQASEIPLTAEDSPGSDEDDDDSNAAGEPDLPPGFSGPWETAMENPFTFNAWTPLLDYVETENHLLAGRKAYDSFLIHFPYCYGYWKKYADLEHRFNNVAVAEEVYKRALRSIPLSVDLWISYIVYLNNNMDMKLPESIEKLRGVFKSAVAAAGLDFRSDKLWNMYTEWEIAQGNFKGARAIYDHVLTIPTQLYRRHHERFKELVFNHSPREILTEEELHWICSKIKNEGESDQIATEDSPSGEDLELLDTDTDMQEKVKEQILMIRQQLFLLNEAEVTKRWTFEDAITRPYFHATPLDRAQLQSWRKYLDFEISQGQHERIVTLYERCLVACSLYEEFWLAYTRYMEPYSVDAARCIFQRACRIHLPLKPALNLQWAAFEEKHGDQDASRTIMCDLEKLIPGLAIIRLRRVSLERRAGNLDEAERLLEEAVRISSGTELAAFYSVKLARLLLKLKRNTEKARKVLAEALDKEPDNPRLHLCLLEVEVSRDVTQAETEADTIQCVERALKSGLDDNVKKILSQRRLEFLEDHGSSVASLLNAYDEHQKLLKQEEDLKSQSENGNNEEEEEKKPICSSERPTLLPTPPYPPNVPLLRGHIAQPYRPVTAPLYRPQSPFVYGPWYQTFGAFNAWNFNRFFQPH